MNKLNHFPAGCTTNSGLKMWQLLVANAGFSAKKLLFTCFLRILVILSDISDKFISVLFKPLFGIVHSHLVDQISLGIGIHDNRIFFIKSDQQYRASVFHEHQYRNILIYIVKHILETAAGEIQNGDILQIILKDSGVVFLAGICFSPMIVSMVPTRPTLYPALSKMDLIR